MTRNRTFALITATVVALAALTGSAAAAPGNSGAQDGNADGHDAGPPGDLPGPVPDFVTEIHAQIQAFLDGSLDDLGAAVRGVVGGEHADNGDDESSAGSTR